MGAATTRLSVYNEAIVPLGERIFATATDQRQSRRIFDALWPLVTATCGARGMWNFAMLTGAIGGVSSSVLGYSASFTKPSDLIRLFLISASATYDPPMVWEFSDLGLNWYANASTIYLAYLSNSGSNGFMNLLNWTPLYEDYVVKSLAYAASKGVTGAYDPNLKAEATAAFISALTCDSLDVINGMLPFNADARSELAKAAPERAASLVPFEKWATMGIAAQGVGGGR